MRYMLLLYSNEAGWQDLSDAERGRWMEKYFDFGGRLAASGAMLETGHFEPVPRTKLVSHDGGKAVVEDRTFHPGAAQLAGFFLIEVESEAEALEWAKACPGSEHGHVEVRGLGAPPDA